MIYPFDSSAVLPVGMGVGELLPLLAGDVELAAGLLDVPVLLAEELEFVEVAEAVAPSLVAALLSLLRMVELYTAQLTPPTPRPMIPRPISQAKMVLP